MLNPFRIWISLALLLAATPAFARLPAGFSEPSSATAHDEVRTSSGTPRYQYWNAAKLVDAIPAQTLDRFQANSGYPKIDPRPRILTQAEYALARDGIRQRGLALLAFFKEAAAGGTSFIIGESDRGFIPKESWDRIVKRQRFAADSRLEVNKVGFYYGADIVRGPDGFYVVEDNLFNPGGLDDIQKTRDLFLNAFPRFREALPLTPGPADVLAGIQTFSNEMKAKERETGRAVLFTVGADTAYFTSRGIRVAATPRPEFLGDKEFYIFVPEIIRKYLGEEPLIQNIPTTTAEAFRAEFGSYPTAADLKDMVLKQADSLGGEGVYVGPKSNAAKLATAETELKRDPGRYLLQEFLPLSHAYGRILDFRLHSLIALDGCWISPLPITRENPAAGDGRVNVHQGGSLAPVFIQSEADAREELELKQIAQNPDPSGLLQFSREHPSLPLRDWLELAISEGVDPVGALKASIATGSALELIPPLVEHIYRARGRELTNGLLRESLEAARIGGGGTHPHAEMALGNLLVARGLSTERDQALLAGMLVDVSSRPERTDLSAFVKYFAALFEKGSLSPESLQILRRSLDPSIHKLVSQATIERELRQALLAPAGTPEELWSAVPEARRNQIFDLALGSGLDPEMLLKGLLARQPADLSLASRAILQLDKTGRGHAAESVLREALEARLNAGEPWVSLMSAFAARNPTTAADQLLLARSAALVPSDSTGIEPLAQYFAKAAKGFALDPETLQALENSRAPSIRAVAQRGLREAEILRGLGPSSNAETTAALAVLGSLDGPSQLRLFSRLESQGADFPRLLRLAIGSDQSLAVIVRLAQAVLKRPDTYVAPEAQLALAALLERAVAHPELLDGDAYVTYFKARMSDRSLTPAATEILWTAVFRIERQGRRPIWQMNPATPAPKSVAKAAKALKRPVDNYRWGLKWAKFKSGVRDACRMALTKVRPSP